MEKADFKLAVVGVLVEFSCTHAITTYVLCIRELSEHEIFRMYFGRALFNELQKIYSNLHFFKIKKLTIDR